MVDLVEPCTLRGFFMGGQVVYSGCVVKRHSPDRHALWPPHPINQPDGSSMADPVGAPLAFKTVEELEEAVESYFQNEAYIGEGDDRLYAPTMSGLALALGVDRKTITNYGHREEYFPTIKKARARVEVALEQRLYGQAVTGVIFNLKNNFGWHDKQELDHTTAGKPITREARELTDEELAAIASNANQSK